MKKTWFSTCNSFQAKVMVIANAINLTRKAFFKNTCIY